MVAENIKTEALEQRIVQLEKQLQDAERKLRQKEQAIQEKPVYFSDTEHIGVWTWNPERNEMFWDRAMHQILGTNPETYEVTPEGFWEHIHPADREVIEKIVRKAMKDDIQYTINYRIIRENSSVVKVVSKAEIFRDENGRAVQIVGICADTKSNDNHEITLQHNDNNEPVIVVKGISEKQYQELAEKKQKYKKMWKANEQAMQQMKEKQEKLQLSGRELQDEYFELDQLVHKMSMDVKAPLASMLGLVNLINLETDINKIQEYAQLIENRILKLDNFMMSMMNFSRANRRKMKYQRIDFERLINQCLEDLKFLKDYKKIDKQIIIEPDNSTFICDALRLRIILANIISNAIKYQKVYAEENSVRIHVQVNDKEGVITVSDNGTGINEHYLEKVFEMFVRANEQSEGAGLGLYIVGKIVAKLGGKIELKSKEMEHTEVKIIVPNRK